ncbi:hypothetical protein BC833DRAFT_529286 [Globomyces pollinis-pini]|nr:hypothetical protein BC833DRAFT_529286 [Globomyces pollinis-pini]
MAATANWVYVLAGPDGNFFRSPNFRCNSPKQAVEWREMSPPQQLNYLNAVKCLREKPSQFPGESQSVYNDLVLVHQKSLEHSHDKPIFLPWHRLFLGVFDSALTKKCNYQGPFPYWDWSRDSQAPETSSIWDNTYGFGGKTSRWSGCLVGPFAGIQRYQGVKGCVRRTWNGRESPLISATYTEVQLEFVMNSRSFSEFSHNLELLPHNSIHLSVGGDMADVSISVNDPIFFLHHRNLDRLWNIWQSRNPSLAYTYSNDFYEIIHMFGLVPDEPVHSVMNISGARAFGLICYKYSNSIVPRTSDVVKRDNSSSNSTIGAKQTLSKSPGPFDRNNLEKIRYIEPLPEQFLKNKGYSSTQIQAIRLKELEIRKITDKINQDDTFKSKIRLEVLNLTKFSWKSRSQSEIVTDTQTNKKAFKNAVAKVME